MSRGRRALLLAGLAAVLGGLASSDIAGREQALRRHVGELAPVVVARTPIAAGRRVRPSDLAVRRVPARFAPRGALGVPAPLVGLRAQIDIGAGTDVVAGMLASARPAPAGAPVRPGERIADVVAVGSPELVVPGERVDVLVTREPTPGAAGHTIVAIEDVEVLAAAPAGAAEASGHGDGGPTRVSASLRVTLRQAVYLAAAQSFAREVRLLPRAATDRRHGATGLSAGDDGAGGGPGRGP